jgi:hypothetical protein
VCCCHADGAGGDTEEAAADGADFDTEAASDGDGGPVVKGRRGRAGFATWPC